MNTNIGFGYTYTTCVGVDGMIVSSLGIAIPDKIILFDAINHSKGMKSLGTVFIDIKDVKRVDAILHCILSSNATVVEDTRYLSCSFAINNGVELDNFGQVVEDLYYVLLNLVNCKHLYLEIDAGVYIYSIKPHKFGSNLEVAHNDSSNKLALYNK